MAGNAYTNTRLNQGIAIDAVQAVREDCEGCIGCNKEKYNDSDVAA